MKIRYFLILSSIFLFTSCAPNIVDTWQVQRYEVIENGESKTISKNVGTITFEKDGSGTKNITYRVFQNKQVDKIPFQWSKQEGYITINNSMDKKSSFEKTWIIVKKGGDRQVWKSTDGKNSVQILELTKK